MTSLSKPLAALALSAFVLAACGDSSDPKPNAVQAAQATPDLSILVEAVGAAELADTLSGPGPFTVFAPTNAAFADLLAELGLTKDELLADKPLLTAVLTYHVLDAKVLRAQVPAGKAITTKQGGVFKIDAEGAALTITDGRNRTAGIVATDLEVSNGVVHVIDRVILPADKTVVETAQALPGTFGILVDAVIAAGLADDLSGPGPFTVFAPTDAAFADLLAELGTTKEALLADTALLTAVLTYHVIPGRVLEADIVPGVQPATLQGGTFSVGAAGITDARTRTAGISSTDVLASNGVIHVIDKVILPAP